MTEQLPAEVRDPAAKEHCSAYPLEPKSPHRRCPNCGRFLRWDDYFGQYLEHASWDDYYGGWEATC